MTNPTTPFSWSMPTASDLVTDLPADFETFGQAVATSMADLLGGTSGQVLSKASNTDMDFTWVTTDDTNAIQNAIVDAKGDLIAATAADTPARLAVGTNNFFLRANSAAATGLEWVGSMTTSTPTLTQSGTVTTSSATTRYLQIGKMVFGSVFIVVSGTGTAGNRVKVTLPVGPYNGNVFSQIGNGTLYDASTTLVYPMTVVCEDATNFNLTVPNAVAANGQQYVGINTSNFSLALGVSDQIGFTFAYEVS